MLFNDWSEKKQRLKIKATTTNVDFINDKLNNLELFLFDKYNNDYNNKKHISKAWLKNSVFDFFGRVDKNDEYKAYLVSWVEKFVKDAPNRLYRGKLIKPRSVKNYNGALNKLKAFEEHTKKRYRFEDIDLTFHQEFIHFCRDVENLNNNSIGNLISRIKTFCREIEFEGYNVNPQYKSSNFNAPKNETFDTYLNEEEINKIFNHDFSDNIRLDNARDLFVIGLRTGLRISDFLRIDKGNIIGNVINITTLKTEQNLTIPIHPQFQKILEKRNGEFPKKISDQKFNKYIKEVCQVAEINTPTYGAAIKEGSNKKELDIYPKYKLISSHTCRRSFATNLFLEGFEASVIMMATGHKSIKQFLQYIKASQDEHIKKLSKYWESKNK
ncbi:tyrosine-type recombinase/integrase [Xanthomarina sp. F2636L]|uniref:tyrosine-type recombinase/integrase n=1 Tax=Xanthomarina sp. F2636L TaxID=2996018 RepID=UPI00225E0631|nr:site-specific integrase [Xanthomarina sp. F2636L]MCX7551551.1 tyrosine-type recombinase/integrase [Xanthomarina sp. F2636L]